jgi:hypothetical protein
MKVSKQVFVKVAGVTPKELADLHALYKYGTCQEATHKVFHQKTQAGDSYPIVLEIVSSKLDKKHDTYTVEFQVNAVITDICPPSPGYHSCSENSSSAGEWELRPAAIVLLRIWEILGVFPLDETFKKAHD